MASKTKTDTCDYILSHIANGLAYFLYNVVIVKMCSPLINYYTSITSFIQLFL